MFYAFFKNLAESNFNLINRVLDEIGQKMLENTINATINMTTRDTKEGIADLICEILTINRKVWVIYWKLAFFILFNYFRIMFGWFLKSHRIYQ